MSAPLHPNLRKALTLPGAFWTAKTRAFAYRISALWECDRSIGAWVNLLHAYEQDHGESLALQKKRSGVRAAVTKQKAR